MVEFVCLLDGLKGEMDKMKKKVFKKTYPIAYLYPGNSDVFQFEEEYYTIYETVIDGVKACFYNRSQSKLKKTNDGGKNYEETIQFVDNTFFISLDVSFDDIKEKIIASDGMLECILED